MNNQEKIDIIVNDIQKWSADAEQLKLPNWDDLPEIELYMDQVIVLMDKYLSPFMPDIDKQLTASMINNYVKMEVMPPPQKKKYSKMHLAYLIIICLLKQSLSISEISELIKLRLSTDPINEVLNSFVKKYVEIFIKSANDISAKIKERCIEIEDDNSELRMINDIIIESAIKSSTGRIIAANIFKFNG